MMGNQMLGVVLYYCVFYLCFFYLLELGKYEQAKEWGVINMAFFDYDRNGKKDWKDNAREYYLYNKLKDTIVQNHTQHLISQIGRAHV